MPRGGALLFVVFAVWVAAICLVGIRGDFPLSDDWAYAHVVRSLAEGRGFDFLPWTGASLIFQALYGAAVTKIAGFSYETLRVSTLAISAAGIGSTYLLVRQAGGDARIAAAAAATVAFSPLWFNLSFTFMTDVPFAALATISAWLYARAFRIESRAGLVVAGVAAAAAFLVRQHGIWIAAAAALTALAAASPARASLRARIVDSAAAAIVPGVVAVAYVAWALTSHVVPLALHNKIDEAASVTVLTLANATFRGIATLGFFLVPWAVVPTPHGARDRRRSVVIAVLALLAAAAVFLYVREDAAMFYLSNMLGGWWIGPWTTRDVQFLAHVPQPETGLVTRALLTASSILSAAVIVSRIVVPSVSPSADGRRITVFCVLAFVLSALGTLTQAHYYFDRYLIVLVPLAIAAVVALSPGGRIGVAFAAALSCMAVYAVAGTHDYMEWHRARWDLLRGLEARGVTARSIDGGVEYNGERLAAELRTSPTDAEARRGASESRKSWWWVVDDQWVISVGPLEGYRLAETRPYPRWLPPKQDRVLLLERNNSPKNEDSMPQLSQKDAG